VQSTLYLRAKAGTARALGPFSISFSRNTGQLWLLPESNGGRKAAIKATPKLIPRIFFARTGIIILLLC
jgi:hypothetical protein